MRSNPTAERTSGGSRFTYHRSNRPLSSKKCRIECDSPGVVTRRARVPNIPSARPQSPTGTADAASGTLVREPRGIHSTSRSGSSSTTTHGRAFQMRPCQVSRSTTTSPLDHIPPVRQLRNRPRWIGPPVLPAGRPWARRDDTFSLGADLACLLRCESPCFHERVELVFVLPAPAAVWLDPDVESEIVGVKAERRPAQRLLDVDVPAFERPCLRIPEQLDLMSRPPPDEC